MKINMLYRKVIFRCLQLSSYFVSTILGIICGFGCIKNEIVATYGVQSAHFKVLGTVVSSDQNLPIRGLLITIQNTIRQYDKVDSAKTDSLGRYSIEYLPISSASDTWELNVKDNDLNENGSFASKDTIFSISDSEQKSGHAEKTVDIKLDRME